MGQLFYISIIFSKTKQLGVDTVFFKVFCQLFCRVIIPKNKYFFINMVAFFIIISNPQVYEAIDQ